MLGIPLGLAVANATEWLMHKYVLHGLGRKKGELLGVPLARAPPATRARNGHVDPDYQRPLFSRWNGAEQGGARRSSRARSRVAPLLPIAPFFVGTVAYCAVNYYRKHKRAHLDPAWAREHLPWHYDHHMGPNQHANWCVTRPWFDQLMGTREPYVGTERERRDLERRARRLTVLPGEEQTD